MLSILVWIFIWFSFSFSFWICCPHSPSSSCAKFRVWLWCWWCVTKAEYGLCDAKINVFPQLQSMIHLQFQINPQTDAQTHKNIQRKDFLVFWWWWLMNVATLVWPSYDKHNARIPIRDCMGSFEDLNHSVICSLSGQRLLHNLRWSLQTNFKTQKNPFSENTSSVINDQTIFNVFITMRAHVYIGFGN